MGGDLRSYSALLLVFFTNKPNSDPKTELCLYSKEISLSWLVAEHTTIGGNIGQKTEIRLYSKEISFAWLVAATHKHGR